MPLVQKAPKLCPALPLKRSWIVSSGRPSSPYLSDTSEPRIVPTVRSVLQIGISSSTRSPFWMAGAARRISFWSSAVSRSVRLRLALAVDGSRPRARSGLWKSALKSRPWGCFQWPSTLPTSRVEHGWPIISSTLRKPSSAISSRSLLGDPAAEVVAPHLSAFRRSARAAPDPGWRCRPGRCSGGRLAHHDAAHGDQRRRREAELVSAEQRRDHHVAPGLRSPPSVWTRMRPRRSFMHERPAASRPGRSPRAGPRT